MDRLRSSPHDRAIEEEAQSDQARVLYSSPFRRLQNKAQVFALEPNAAVRSRLTHSLEVSSVGRLIALAILRQFGPDRASLGLTEGYESAFVTFAETACLLHDIGNPPFGHYGELAISEWFSRHKGDLKKSSFGKTVRDSDWDLPYRDFTAFDGNPQGVRIVVRLQWHDDEFGLNLTATQIASMIKYPISTTEAQPKSVKAGFFQTESSIQARVWEILGMPLGIRHPLVMIMEAADDIGYCMSDIEDALEKEVISYEAFVRHMRAFTRFSDRGWIPTLISLLPDTPNGLMPLLDFRTTLTRTLTKICATQYVKEHDVVLAGSCESLFIKGSAECALLEHLKTFAKEHIYRSGSVRDRELVAYSVLSGLLDTYKPLLTCDEDAFLRAIRSLAADGYLERPSIEGTLLSRFPRKHRQAYLDAVNRLPPGDGMKKRIEEWMLRAHLVVDFVSGMTDDFAFEMHNLTSGTRRGSI